MINKKIDSEKFYTPDEISEENLFPWINHRRGIISWLRTQIKLANGLKWEITIKPGLKINGNRYFVKGSGIIKIIAAFEDGSLFENK